MESSNSTKIRIPLTVEEQYLADRDKYIFDLLLSFDLFELHQLAMQHSRYLVDFYHAWEYDLAKFIVPQTYNFPKFLTGVLPITFCFKGSSFLKMGQFFLW
jgi:hypothetical protein